ncbi:MAG: alanine racemase [Desertimonas sp.]
MTLRLRVERVAWLDHVHEVARHHPGVIPVVKGNGYGFGRRDLAEIASSLSDTIAVGTVHELADLPAGARPVVLTPTRRPPADLHPILTVGSRHDVAALTGWQGRIVVKLASSMRRFGVEPDGLGELMRAIRRADLDVAAFAVHPPLAGTDDEHIDDIARWLPVLGDDDEVWVSHLSRAGYHDLREAWPDRRFRIRLGTALWHGDKSMLRLGADVLAVHAVRAGEPVGYRQRSAPGDGWLVVIGAGSAHGVDLLADGRSPFHHDRRRLTLIEPPHMHTSMAFVPTGERGPDVGETVDVQRPLITTDVDEIRWT